MNTINFTVPSIPVAQPRQRHRVISCKGKSFVHNYTPKSDPVNTFKASIQMALNEIYHGPVLQCPVTMHIICIFPRPKNKIWKSKEMPREPHTSKPDRDNVQKAVQDALEGILYRNDSQVFDGRVAKFIASGNEQPHVTITVEY